MTGDRPSSRCSQAVHNEAQYPQVDRKHAVPQNPRDPLSPCRPSCQLSKAPFPPLPPLSLFPCPASLFQEECILLQKKMGMADGRDTATAQTDKPGSIPWWAQEMGMTEEEYWSGLHSYSGAVASGSDMTHEAARKVEMSQVSPLLQALFFPLSVIPLSVSLVLCSSLSKQPPCTLLAAAWRGTDCLVRLPCGHGTINNMTACLSNISTQPQDCQSLVYTFT